MARLRVRLELNRRSAGVPLDKLASVVEETRKFFHLLAEDVRIDDEHGEWVASDFDPESLNFTAEYSGAVTAEQVRAFGAAFAGATSLRRLTIAQFTRIADFLGEDELVGFGLFQEEGETEPSEWRCLSKRDAQRFGQEIRLLAEAAGESQPETALPAVMNGSIAGRRLFKDRREREALAADPAKMIREVESNLSRRIGLLEGEVAAHTRRMKEARELGPAHDTSDERFQQLLSAMEKFWAQAPRQMPLLSAPEVVEPAKPGMTSEAEKPAAARAVAVETELEKPAAAQVLEAGPEADAKLVALRVAAELERPAEVSAVAAAAGLAEPELTAAPKPAAVEAVGAAARLAALNVATESVAIEAEKVVEANPPEPAKPETVEETASPETEEVSAKKPKRWWVAGGVMAAGAVALSLVIGNAHGIWSRYTVAEAMPVVHPKAPAAPVLPVVLPVVPVAKVEKVAEKPKASKPEKPQRFEGPQIALEIPASVRTKVPEEARVEVIVAIDEQGNVTRAEVASTKGKGAQLLKKEALAAARGARFRPAREGERAVESQMVLTYLFKPDTGEF
jgi:TonB family protein